MNWRDELVSLETENARLTKSFQEDWCGTLALAKMRRIRPRLRELQDRRARLTLVRMLSTCEPGIVLLVSHAA